MKILITNIYSWKNKGDAAIVLSMLEDIKKQFPSAEIYLSSFDPNDNKKYGDFKFYRTINGILYPNFKNLPKCLMKFIWFMVRIKIFELINLLGVKPYFLFFGELKEKIKSYSQFDLIIACGGGYLLTKSQLSIFPIKTKTYDFYLASLFNKNYILYNQSIGPFMNQWHFLFIRKALSKAKLIICREVLTYNRLKKYGLKNIILSHDIAFNLKSKENDALLRKYKYDKKNINIGITVRNWLKQNKQKIYEKEIAKFIIQKINYDNKIVFYFMPQVIFKEFNDNDLIVARRICSYIPDKIKKNVIIVDEDLHPCELKYIISKMNFFIGTRMHSNIFALSSNVKTIAICYEPKTRGIMKMIGLNNYVMDMDKMASENLHKIFDNLKKDKEYIKKLKKEIPKIRDKNSGVIAKRLYKTAS